MGLLLIHWCFHDREYHVASWYRACGRKRPNRHRAALRGAARLTGCWEPFPAVAGPMTWPWLDEFVTNSGEVNSLLSFWHPFPPFQLPLQPNSTNLRPILDYQWLPVTTILMDHPFPLSGLPRVRTSQARKPTPCGDAVDCPQVVLGWCFSCALARWCQDETLDELAGWIWLITSWFLVDLR